MLCRGGTGLHEQLPLVHGLSFSQIARDVTLLCVFSQCGNRVQSQLTDMSLFLRPANRAATRSLSQKSAVRCPSRRNLLQAPLLASIRASSRRQSAAVSFSTMSTLKAVTGIAGAAVGGGREYDPEIKDMASYVHNYKIASDLAVSYPLPIGLSELISRFRWTLPDMSF